MRIDACRWVRTRLALLAGDDLIGPERRRTERHLVGCPACRRHLASLRGAVQALRSAAEVPALAPEVMTPLWPALARQIRESRRPVPWPWPWLRVLTRPAFALAATLLLTVGVVTLWPGFGSTSTPTPAPAVGHHQLAARPLVAADQDDSRRRDVPEHALADRPDDRLDDPLFDDEHARLIPPPPVQDTR